MQSLRHILVPLGTTMPKVRQGMEQILQHRMKQSMARWVQQRMQVKTRQRKKQRVRPTVVRLLRMCHIHVHHSLLPPWICPALNLPCSAACADANAGNPWDVRCILDADELDTPHPCFKVRWFGCSSDFGQLGAPRQPCCGSSLLPLGQPGRRGICP